MTLRIGSMMWKMGLYPCIEVCGVRSVAFAIGRSYGINSLSGSNSLGKNTVKIIIEVFAKAVFMYVNGAEVKKWTNLLNLVNRIVGGELMFSVKIKQFFGGFSTESTGYGIGINKMSRLYPYQRLQSVKDPFVIKGEYDFMKYGLNGLTKKMLLLIKD